MSLQLKVYDNADHAFLVWFPTEDPPVAIPDCLGFTIKKTLTRGGVAQQPTFLSGFAGFADNEPLPPQGQEWKRPVQRFMWWDPHVQPGDTVKYQVIPVCGPDHNNLSLNSSEASQEITCSIAGQSTPNMSAFFNRGIVAAQWVSGALKQQPAGAKLGDLIKDQNNSLRKALSGILGSELFGGQGLTGLLTRPPGDKSRIFAALYELNDPEVISALESYGQDCSLILANGAFKSNTPPDNDENADVRKQLQGKVQLFDRIVTEGHFAHNKFIVFCDETGKPQQVWTGSTNMTSSGLCTQANNGILIKDPDVAANFMKAWIRLKNAGNGYPSDLIDGNSTSQTFDVDGCKVTPWFAATSDGQDMDFARNLINQAKDGILFLFFNPGTFSTIPAKQTLLQTILSRHSQDNVDHYDPDLLFWGVVNQEIPVLTPSSGKGKAQPDAVLDPSQPNPAPVTLFKNGIEPPQSLSHDVMIPTNIKDQFHDWQTEVLGAGVHVHSKVIVLDPFGENPVVMTGSHNLGHKASSMNDDNLVIIEGNAPLAAAYAINILSIYQAYRWNNYVHLHEQDPRVWHGLIDTPSWQDGYLQGEDALEIKFWLR